ncbi:hypothetical protein WA026_007073 [Henosepilachna vigintioctopunctata]|uniref:Uncharacterized protein n=1 Tax=Henosepilachna vigintioctopunctata TaxID=420089 RepID=A0AAW1V1Y1_9CUCU
MEQEVFEIPINIQEAGVIRGAECQMYSSPGRTARYAPLRSNVHQVAGRGSGNMAQARQAVRARRSAAVRQSGLESHSVRRSTFSHFPRTPLTLTPVLSNNAQYISRTDEVVPSLIPHPKVLRVLLLLLFASLAALLNIYRISNVSFRLYFNSPVTFLPVQSWDFSQQIWRKRSSAITTYFLNTPPGQIPYVVPLCPVVPCPEISVPPAAYPLTQAPCPCGQCAPHMYANHVAAPSTLIVNRFTEINYFDNPPLAAALPEKYNYDMIIRNLASLETGLISANFQDSFASKRIKLFRLKYTSASVWNKKLPQITRLGTTCYARSHDNVLSQGQRKAVVVGSR